MNNLILLSETLTNGFNPLALDFLSFGAILSGILVITSRNPVVSILFLIALFVNIAGYLILMGVTFLGLSYVLVYVGAIAILFLFVIMMMNIRLSELHAENSSDNIPLGITVGIAFLYPLYSIIPSTITEAKSSLYYVFNWFNSILTGYTNSNLEDNFFKSFNKYEYNVDVESIVSNLWDNNITSYTQLSSIGNVMYTNYALWFFIVSIILLLAMVGAIVLTFKPTTKI